MTAISVGSCKLGDRPRVAAALSDAIELSAIDQALSEGVDFLEVRADLFPRQDVTFIAEYLNRLRPRPVLLTIRHAAEGGRWSGDETSRLDWYARLLPMADAVDVEIRSDIAARVADLARQQGKPVIGSFHDFQATPDRADLDRLAEDFSRGGMDILKVAAWCRDSRDLRRLAAFLCDWEGLPMIVLGMGPAGRPGRLLFPFLGSLVTYTYLGTASAPGQLNHRELVELLERIRGSAGSGGSQH
ncbi:MAG TPA: type I 3-dehydroquinate dehydratase [Candidatus Hydrogenedentes bacterium]|nr:type I 3-dehydroquinate dehydratase [Candidatus Hydrogenedentota bacterium]